MLAVLICSRQIIFIYLFDSSDSEGDFLLLSLLMCRRLEQLND